MAYPQELRAQIISYLRNLERKGIRSVCLAESLATLETPKNNPSTGAAAVGDAVSENITLESLTQTVSTCTRCALHESRTRTVFGVGNPKTKVMFIGEAPGRDEDRQGEPFVGRAGQLLTKILAAIDLKREDVYITNILKCRPPQNRDPQESEVRCCEAYLVQQIELIQPKLICALGRIAAQWLLKTDAPLSALRAGEYEYQGIQVIPTYHPAALLRNPNFKKPCWEDMKKLKALMDAS